MSDPKKRRIPRHVDGRIKVGLMPIKDFLKFLPIGILILAFVATHISPITLFLGTVLLGISSAFFCEFQQKETGMDILKSKIKYHIEGDKYFERGCLNASTSERRSRNKIKIRK